METAADIRQVIFVDERRANTPLLGETMVGVGVGIEEWARAAGTAERLRATKAAVRNMTTMRLFLDTLAPMSHGTSEQHQQLLVCRTDATRLGSSCRSGTGGGTHCMESVAKAIT